MTLTTRGRVAIYCVAALLIIGLLIWADYAMSIPGIDDALVDATELQ